MLIKISNSKFDYKKLTIEGKNKVNVMCGVDAYKQARPLQGIILEHSLKNPKAVPSKTRRKFDDTINALEFNMISAIYIGQLDSLSDQILKSFSISDGMRCADIYIDTYRSLGLIGTSCASMLKDMKRDVVNIAKTQFDIAKEGIVK